MVRSGTVDKGRHYEANMSALLSLKAASENNIEEMETATNMDKCLPFDDVIIRVKEKERDHSNTYLIQLKHSDKSKTINIDDLVSKKAKNFALKKYCEGYCSFRDHHQKSRKLDMLGDIDSISLIIYTNSIFDEEYDFLETVENDTLQFLKTNSNGIVYKINFNKFITHMCADIKNQLGYFKNPQFNEFTQKLLIFVNQTHVSKISELLHQEFSKYFLVNDKTRVLSAVSNYRSFFDLWTVGNLQEQFYTLTKSCVINKVIEIILEPYDGLHFKSEKKFKHNDCMETWNTILKNKSVTIVEKDSIVEDFLLEYICYKINFAFKINIHKMKYIRQWTDHFSLNDKNKILKSIKNNTKLDFELSRSLTNPDIITVFDLYKVLWRIGEIPKIVKADTENDYKFILHALDNSQCTLKFIIIFNELSCLNASESLRIFSKLSDLDSVEQKSILDLGITLQGRPTILRNINGIDKCYDYIHVKDIIYCLTNKFKIGNTFEKPSFYVPQTLSVPVLTPEVLQLENQIFVINSNEQLFVEYLKRNKLEFKSEKQHMEKFTASNKNKITYKCINTWEEFSNKCNIYIVDNDEYFEQILHRYENKTVHKLHLHEMDSLKWISTRGDIKSIQKFEKYTESNSVLTNQNNFHEIFVNKFHIIFGEPGVGKSTYLNYLTDKISTEWWILYIELNNYLDRNGDIVNINLNIDEQINFFNNESLKKGLLNNKQQEMIFHNFLNSKRIILVLDAFDEICPDYKQNINGIIKQYYSSNFKVILTTRPFMQSYLEESFNSLAFRLNPLDKQNQFMFLKQYFKKTYDDEETITEFSNSLLDATNENLNDQNHLFTSIPLQCILLAEAFKQQLPNFTETGKQNIEKFDILWLYEIFVNSKLNLVKDKNGLYSKYLHDQLEQYQQLQALNTIFPKKYINEINVDEQIKKIKDFENDINEISQRYGLIVQFNEFNVTFVHRTFAEYFSAVWLSKNYKNEKYKNIVKELLKVLFDQTYDFSRGIFDRLLAKGNELHTAIINKQFHHVDKILDLNPDIVNNKDTGGRSLLHIIGAWGERHDLDHSFPTTLKKSRVKSLKNNVSASLKKIVENTNQYDQDSILEYYPLDYAFNTLSLDIADILAIKFDQFSVDLQKLHNYIINCNEYNYKNLVKIIITFAKNNCINLNADSQYDPLLQASQCGNFEIVPALLFAGEGVYKRVKRTYTRALHLACKNGHTETAKILITNKGDVNMEDSVMGRTALHKASDEGHSETVILLISAGSDVNKADIFFRCNALHLACENGHSETAKILITNNADVNAADTKLGRTALHKAAENGHSQTVSLLVLAGADVNKTDTSFGCTALQLACEEGHSETAKILITNKADVNAIDTKYGGTALHNASRNGHSETVSLLVSAGADVNKTDSHLGSTALHVSCRNGHLETAKILIAKGVDINKIESNSGSTALHLACENGHTETAKVLINNKADVNAVDTRTVYGGTALHNASRNGHSETVSLLVSAGADVNKIDSHLGSTALHLSCRNGHSETAKILIANKADVNAADTILDRTALHWASLNGHSETVSLLVHSEADVNKTDSYLANTALHLACENGHSETAKILITNKADVDAKDSNTHTALDRASLNDHSETVSLLISYKAEMDVQKLFVG